MLKARVSRVHLQVLDGHSASHALRLERLQGFLHSSAFADTITTTPLRNKAMKIASAFVSLMILAGVASPSSAQNKSGVEKLYIINCGEGVAGNAAIWSPGVNVGKPQAFTDSCYLIKHAQGWFLW